MNKIYLAELIERLHKDGYEISRISIYRAEKLGRLPFKFHKTFGQHRFIFKKEYETVLKLLLESQNGEI